MMDFFSRPHALGFILVVAILGTVSCGSETDPQKRQLAYQLVQEEGALLLDVRTFDEFRAGHLPGARNVPVSRIPEELGQIRRWVDHDLSHPVVVYCTAGVRAARAQQELESAGFERVVNLGGLNDWPGR